MRQHCREARTIQRIFEHIRSLWLQDSLEYLIMLNEMCRHRNASKWGRDCKRKNSKTGLQPYAYPRAQNVAFQVVCNVYIYFSTMDVSQLTHES